MNCKMQNDFLSLTEAKILTYKGIGMATTKTRQFDEEIAALRAALTRVEADLAIAIADVQVNGLSSIVVVLDSHGKAISKNGLNPACKIITTAERLRRSLLRQLAVLEDAARKVEHEEKQNPWSKFAPKERKQ
jgi:hypothetical protein